MPRRPVSREITARIPILFYEQDFSVKQICQILGIGKTLVYQTLRHYSKFALPHNPYSRPSPGRDRSLSSADVETIHEILQQEPTIYLDELQFRLLELRGISCSITTLARTIRRLHFSRKAVSARAIERNDLDRSIYMNQIAEIVPDPEMFIFIDEAARDRRTSARQQGYAPSGMRCVQRRHFVRGQRYSILPMLTLDGIVAYDIIEGSVTSDRFLQFLRDYVIPYTNPYPGPRSVLVMDNCSIHHAEEIRALIEDEALCKLVFLPPYSPDLNPIEQAFSAIKAYLRRHWKDDSLSIMDEACQSITSEKAWSYFRASGYVV